MSYQKIITEFPFMNGFNLFVNEDKYEQIYESLKNSKLPKSILSCIDFSIIKKKNTIFIPVRSNNYKITIGIDRFGIRPCFQDFEFISYEENEEIEINDEQSIIKSGFYPIDLSKLERIISKIICFEKIFPERGSSKYEENLKFLLNETKIIFRFQILDKRSGSLDGDFKLDEKFLINNETYKLSKITTNFFTGICEFFEKPPTLQNVLNLRNNFKFSTNIKTFEEIELIF